MSKSARLLVLFVMLVVLLLIAAPTALAGSHPGPNPHGAGHGCGNGNTYPPPANCPPNAGPKPKNLDVTVTSVTSDYGVPTGVVLAIGGVGAAGLMVLQRRRTRALK